MTVLPVPVVGSVANDSTTSTGSRQCCVDAFVWCTYSRKKAGNLNRNLRTDYRQIPHAQDSGILPLTNKMTGIGAELAGMQEFLQEYGTKGYRKCTDSHQ